MKQGFSLLELSIVLVIIGLITGGIMAGRSMVRAAEFRSVISDISKYRTAINAFREKYNALPGDMKNATSYWGSAASGAACATTVGTGTQTCDGNGDGTVTYSLTNSNEGFRFWQHLANAGMPGTGTILVAYRNVCTNSTSATDYSATYLASAQGQNCGFYWINIF